MDTAEKRPVGRPPRSRTEAVGVASEQLDAFDGSMQKMSLDKVNEAPVQEVEPQTKLSKKDLSNAKDLYLKPERSLPCRAKFNEEYRSEYEASRKYVQFVAENREVIGEMIEMWTKPFAGVPYEFWKIPTNKPVWAPRYVAEQIKKAKYHRFMMQDHVITDANHMGKMYGSMSVETTIQRLDAIPVSASERKSIFV